MGCGGLALLILVLILVLGGKEPDLPAAADEDRTALWTEQPARQQNAVLISRTEQPAVEEINFFHTKAWQDDMLFGYTNEDVYNTTVLNFRGEYLFTLQGDHPFYGVELEREIESLLRRYQDEGKDPNPMAKGMSWVKTNVKLAMDTSDATIADLMTDGCGMGVKSLNKYLNQYKAADEVSKDITKRLIHLEEQLETNLRPFL